MIEKKRFKISFGIFIFVLVSMFLLSSCNKENPLSGKVYASDSISFKCSGEAKVILTDHCYDPETRTLKLLISNGDLADLKHLNVLVAGDLTSKSLRFPLNIEMGESKLLYVEWPDDLGIPFSAKMEAFYFGNTGLENCVPYTLDMDLVRTCGKPQKKTESK